MKSLEIVNEKIDYIEISKSNIKEVSPYYYEKVLLVQLKELEQIKQDLEVLEIIRKKKIDIGFVKSILESYSIEEALEINNDCGYRKLTMEELLKLKQWLEVSENANK